MLYACDTGELIQGTAPTRSTSHLCALAGDLAINQLLRWYLGLGRGVLDTEVEWNGYSLATRVFPLERKASCRAEHDVWSVVVAKRPLPEVSLSEIARSAGLHGKGSLERASFRLGSATWLEHAVCSAGHRSPVAGFVADSAAVGDCARCGRSLRAEPFFRHRAVSAALLAERLDTPLAELCTSPPRWVLVHGTSGAVLVQSPDSIHEGGTR